ncbi:MAG: SRPBCC domain-containing protein [Pseudomonadota bacterium]
MSDLLHATTVRRLIRATRPRVFAAFSRAEALEQWFSPSADIAVTVLAFEFAEGGTYRFRYAMPDGSHPTLGGAFTCIEEPARLAFTWVWEAPDPHAGIPTLVSVALHARGQATELVLTHSQIPSEEIAARHAAGWEATLDHLEDALWHGALPPPLKWHS